MNKEYVKNELIKKLDIDNDKALVICDIADRHFVIGKKNRDKFINDIVNELNVTQEEADNIYNVFMGIIGDGIKEKIKHPFKSLD